MMKPPSELHADYVQPPEVRNGTNLNKLDALIKPTRGAEKKDLSVHNKRPNN